MRKTEWTRKQLRESMLKVVDDSKVPLSIRELQKRVNEDLKPETPVSWGAIKNEFLNLVIDSELINDLDGNVMRR